MNIKVEKLFPRVYLLTFDTRYELCMSFIRWQEFYESPKFRGKYFELEEFMDYWSKEFGNGSFDYPATWNGFNIPGQIILDWVVKQTKAFGAPRGKEMEVLHELQTILNDEGDTISDSYIIAAHKDQSAGDMKATMDHEVAHAFYHLYPKYRRSCNKLIKKASKKDIATATRTLLELGYCKKVLNDEIQAYFSTYNVKNTLTPKLKFCKNLKDFRNSLKNN